MAGKLDAYEGTAGAADTRSARNVFGCAFDELFVMRRTLARVFTAVRHGPWLPLNPACTEDAHDLTKLSVVPLQRERLGHHVVYCRINRSD